MTRRIQILCAALCAVAIGLTVITFIAIRQHTGAASPAPQPVTERNQFATVEIHESTGGSVNTTGHTDGPEMKLSGDKVSASDLQLTVPIMSFDFGSIGGGSFAGSFKVSSGTARLMQWLCGVLALACAVAGAFKWAGKDYIHAVGQWLCAVGLFLAVLMPELLGWFGLGAIVVLLVSHWFPSATAKTEQALKDYIGTLWTIAPQAAKDVAANLEGKSAVVAAKAGA